MLFFKYFFSSINPSPYDRQTLWGVLIGGFFYWTSFNSVNQTMVQRYMSLPSLKKAQYSIIIFTIGIILFISVCCFAGLLVYNFYKDCDPMTSGLITVRENRDMDEFIILLTFVIIYVFFNSA